MSLFVSKKGMTLIEILISVTILSSIMIITLQAIGGTLVFRKQSTDELDLATQSYLALEMLTLQIKNGGSIDYEEYWNRQMIGTGVTDGVYSDPTGYGNYGSGGTLGGSSFGTGVVTCLYHSGATLNSCDTNGNDLGVGISMAGAPQRYGSYKAQHYLYRSPRDSDDEDPGKGPYALDASGSTRELYLIRRTDSGRSLERLILRNRLIGADGRLEILKLIGSDEGLSHDKTGAGYADGLIDTWRCHRDFSCAGYLGVGGSPLPLGTGSEFVPLLPDYLSVKNFEIQVLPAKDGNKNWRDQRYSLAQHVRLSLTIGWSDSYRSRLSTISKDKTVTLTTLINLDNVGRQ